jgi:signal transduction histidine kinase
MKRFASLRSRLLVLVLVAVLPAFALTLYTNLEQRRAAAAAAQEEALRIARIAASEQNGVFQDARRVLFTLAHLREVRTLNAQACRPLLAELLSRSPEYASISIAAPTGDVVCTGGLLTGSINLGDREYFQRALTTRDVAMSGYLLGRISKKAALAIAYPAIDARGTVSAVVVIGLDLRSLNHLAADAQLPQGSTLLVIDRAGVILARHPHGEEWVGKQVSDAPLAKAILTKHGEGTIADTGLDGVPRLYGLTRLSATPDAGEVYLAVGIPRSVALAEPNRALVRNLVLLGVIGVLVLVGARVVAERLVLRRTEALTAATKRLAAGDLGARTGLPGDDSELGHLARSFDEMAEAVEQRTAERARAAAELVRSEKMAALGRLAAGVAHELRNPLSVIAGRIEILRHQMAPGQAPTFDVLTRSLVQFEEASDRMRRIMEGLSTYSKPAKPDPTPLDLGGLLTATKEVLAYEARKHEVSIVVQVPPRLPRVVGDRSALMQVFVNLATNAVQAMADTGGGQLTLKAYETAGNGAPVVAEVTDTGPGIPPDALAQIWATFYTTKAEGTGIGLSIVRALVEQQPGAAITVESHRGAGTTFRLTMPAGGADSPAQSSAS